METAICAGVRLFEQEYMGRWPKDIHVLVVVRLKRVDGGPCSFCTDAKNSPFGADEDLPFRNGHRRLASFLESIAFDRIVIPLRSNDGRLASFGEKVQ